MKLLDGKGSLHKFLWNFRKCLSASILFTKLLLDLFANKENGSRGFRKTAIPVATARTAWRQCRGAAVSLAPASTLGPLAARRDSLEDKEDPHDALDTHLPPLPLSPAPRPLSLLPHEPEAELGLAAV